MVIDPARPHRFIPCETPATCDACGMGQGHDVHNMEKAITSTGWRIAALRAKAKRLSASPMPGYESVTDDIAEALDLIADELGVSQ